MWVRGASLTLRDAGQRRTNSEGQKHVTSTCPSSRNPAGEGCLGDVLIQHSPSCPGHAPDLILWAMLVSAGHPGRGEGAATSPPLPGCILVRYWGEFEAQVSGMYSSQGTCV
ncbi:cytochrome c oxidase subunit II [Platysternon megacephalum]|uniref:Cytochrome c oxidase subunit II n=1 Tax=Platysternon megacephalum TaxID=55544 RepID=A0A4D9DJK6_9SAUR|nr:cytochrome c oxidase subunit II [Platysternon megacephalum]